MQQHKSESQDNIDKCASDTHDGTIIVITRKALQTLLPQAETSASEVPLIIPPL